MSFKILENHLFWKSLDRLCNLKEKVELHKLASDLGVENKHLKELIHFFKLMKIEFKEETTLGKKYLLPLAVVPKIKFEFTLSEWLKFQAHFPFLSDLRDKPFHQDLVERLSRLETDNKLFDLFEGLKVFTKEEAAAPVQKFEKYRDELYSAIDKHLCILMQLKDGKHEREYFPHRLVHLDSELSLIAEDCLDKTLLYVPLKDVVELRILKEFYEQPQFGIKEIEDFIEGMRLLSGNEVRLVIKILNPEKVYHLSPLYHFLRKPYVITNPKGELIWAASVEENEDLYEWLSSLRSQVEILDPMSFKKNFLEYCERKLKNIA